MAGFNSQDQLIQALTNGQTYRNDWSKNNTGASVGVVAAIYDTSMWPGNPPQRIHGNILQNSFFEGGTAFWSGIGAGGWAWNVAGNITHTAGTAGSVIQTPAIPIQSGVMYTIQVTTTSIGGTAGVQIGVGGVFNTAITTNVTDNLSYVIAGGDGTVEIRPASTCTVTIDNIYVIAGSGVAPRFCPYTDTNTQGSMWTGGIQTSKSKHILGMSAQTGAATGALSNWLLVDMLGSYPLIDINKTTATLLDNTLTLPRYTNGAGVRAFVSSSYATLSATAHNIAMSYTNSSGVAGRSLGALVAGTSACGLTRLTHTGAAANNYGPFLPLAAGDEGIRSVESFQVSSAVAAGKYNLVLCKPIIAIPITTLYLLSERDLVNQLPSLPRIEDEYTVSGACLNWLCIAGGAIVAGATFWGSVDFIWN